MTDDTMPASQDAPIANFSQCHVGIIGHLDALGELPALMEPACNQPDAKAVVDQHLHAVGSGVGEQVGVMGVGCAEDLYDTGQSGLCTRSHIQGFTGHPRKRPAIPS